MRDGPVGFGVVGCGRIAHHYVKACQEHSDGIRIVGAHDLDTERTRAFAQDYGIQGFDSLAALLADPAVEAVVNLTIHHAHAVVSKRALENGKHVFTEKPLAVTREDGLRLVQCAEEKRLALGCAPFVHQGEAQQTLWKAVRDGLIGAPREAVGNAVVGRIEARNPSAEAFLSPGAGPLFDVGCYPLSVLTTIHGPIRRISAARAVTLFPDRVYAVGPREGESFKVTTPDHVTSLFEFGNGVLGRVNASFALNDRSLPGIVIYGDKGTLRLSPAQAFGARVELCDATGAEWKELPLVAPPSSASVDWSRGPRDLASAIRGKEPLRSGGAQGYHILDASLAMLEVAETGRARDITSTFEPPPPRYA